MSIFQIDRRSIANFDFWLLSLALILNVIGLVNLGSAGGPGLWKSQLFRLLLALVPMAAALVINYTRFEKLAPALYLSALILLLGVHVLGREVNSARSWYDLGFLRLQPSELMKIAVILMLARVYHQRDPGSEPWGVRDLAWPVLIIMLPVLSIIREPDSGTALIMLLIGGTMLLFARVRARVLAVAVILGLLSAYPAWHFMLKPHQQERVLTFISPERDPLGAGYNALQSKIAIGSGGLLGKGYMNGAIHMLRFLPEQQTDFVFSVWAEEWGFFWVAVLLILYGVMIILGGRAAKEAKDRFGVMVAVGCTSLIFWHTFINVAMVAGLFPVIGVPLPFMSYGGSNLITFMIAVALLINVRMRKYYF